jgi:glc operon protein GlcG
MYNEPTLDHVDAEKAITAVLAEFARLGKAGVVAVADSHGELIALMRMAGAPPQSSTIATNKAFSAVRARRPSKDIGTKVRSADQGFDISYFGDSRFVGWGGGVPVIVAGEVVGAVAVSGLTEDEDIALAHIGITAMGLA